MGAAAFGDLGANPGPGSKGKMKRIKDFWFLPIEKKNGFSKKVDFRVYSLTLRSLWRSLEGPIYYEIINNIKRKK